jgi:uncharacterized protein
VLTLLWDASALVKRYAPETGSDVVDTLFALVPTTQMVATVLGYAETYSALLRKYHRGSIHATAFVTAKTSLLREVVHPPEFALLTVDDEAIFAGIALMDQHHVNATDAAILALFVRYVRVLPPATADCLLIAADRRLVLAAQAEGLSALDPEHVSSADVPSLLAAFGP